MSQKEFSEISTKPQYHYHLLPAQKQLIYIGDPDVHIDICVYQGGFGSGKTFIGSLLGHILSSQVPRNRGIVVAKTYPIVRDTTLQTYFEHFDTMGLKSGRDYQWRASEQKLKYKNGSEILFRHLDDPSRIKSLNLGWAHMEEMGDIDESGFLMLLSRLRLKHVSRYRLFGTTNPQNGLGWLRRYFEKDRTFAVPDSTPRPQKIQYRRVLAPSTENSHLSAAYLENMKQQFSAEYYRMNVLGQDGGTQKGLLCPQFSESNLDEALQCQATLRLYLSCDFNVDPMCWVIAHRTQQPGMQIQYEFFDELCIENTNIIQTAEEFARRYASHEAGIVITGDASGRSRSDSSANPNDSKYRILLNTLSNAGMKNVHLDVPSANPHQDLRIETWNGLLCNQDGIRRVKIHPEKCKWLVWNLQNLRYLSGTSVVSEPSIRQIEQDASRCLKFTKHPFDAASYLTYRYDAIRKDAPLHHQKSLIRWQRFSPERLF
ncbi:MAG: phage terminase large subunit [Vampirovibrionales bacterium]|nr:phage terminase large subunit [Vampirovibrionales bacterium]